MAFYESNSQSAHHSRCISIPSYETIDNVTKYTIQVVIGKYFWTVCHRYSDFYELNEKLCASHQFDGSLLPGKKIFGSQTESFIKHRSTQLEHYIKVLFVLEPIPYLVTEFLDFQKYEINSITESLAERLWKYGDLMLQSEDVFHMAPLQCHAVTEQLKLPKSFTGSSRDPKKDIGHILDFLSKVTKLHICGSQKNVDMSNIVPNQLPFSLLPFKSLNSLKLVGCNPEMVKGLFNARKGVIKLQVQDSLKSLKDFFLTDTLHWDPSNILPESKWMAVTSADFSYNQLTALDDSICLISCVEILDVSHNQISEIDHLERLSYLVTLDLSFNQFIEIPPLHTKLGNIVTFRLTDNAIESLKGFSKLYSLVNLDLQNNKVSALTEIGNVINLPCLEKINLIGNPITNSVDYRTRVLEQFNARVTEICLDNQVSTQKELDTAAVLQAIRRAKEPKPNPTTVILGNNNNGGYEQQVRVVHLRGPNPTKNNSTEGQVDGAGDGINIPSASGTDLTEFRQQIANIRSQGGTGWLRLWNQRQGQLGKPLPSYIPVLPSNEIGSIDDDDSRSQTSSTVIFRNAKRDLNLPDWLPTTDDKDFMGTLEALLHQMIPQPSLPQTIDAAFWSILIWFPSRSTGSSQKFPACVVISPSAVTIFLLADLTDFRRPVLQPLRRIDPRTIASLTIGRHNHFICFEERLTNSVNGYILLVSNRGSCESCAAILRGRTGTPVIRQEVPIQDANENVELSNGEQSYSWVTLDDDSCYLIGESIPDPLVRCIAISGSKIVLLQEEMTMGTSKLFVVKTWETNGITNLAIYSSQTEVANAVKTSGCKEGGGFAAWGDRYPIGVSDCVQSTLAESGFGITMWFGETDVLSFRFPSRENRDEFLDVLTRVRTRE